MKNSPTILETTLRDGSYAINFQFTSTDTAVIAGELERAGFEMIEIGHGVGMNASKMGKGEAAETDEAYLKAAAETLTKARWGMFFIPGIGRMEDIDMAADYGMSFIRIGTNVTEMEDSEPYIEHAKKYGMYVSANFMKSYTMEPETFAQKAILTQKFGSDLLCIVDSAGGMLTDRMEEYFHAVQDVCDIPLGFHGHNNLSLAVANSLRAVELGASVIDTSLQGMGRSAGNTPTEIFLLALQRMNIDTGIDSIDVMDIGEKYIKPFITRAGYDAIDMVIGYAEFHSSYMGIIREFASKYRLDPRKLIVAVTEEDKVNAPRDMVERIAKELRQREDGEVFTGRFRLDRYHGAEQVEDDTTN